MWPTHYNAWPKLVDLCAIAPFNGLMEKRGGALIDIDRDALGRPDAGVLRSESIDWDDYRPTDRRLADDDGTVSTPKTRERRLSARRHSTKHNIVRYPLQPFDVRWCYLHSRPPVVERAAPDVAARNAWQAIAFFMTRDRRRQTPEGPPFYCSPLRCATTTAFAATPSHFPLRLTQRLTAGQAATATLFDACDEPRREPVQAAPAHYLAKLGIKDPDADAKTAGLIWMHALAIGYSPAYLTENADGIRRDWPRIPLPADRKALEASAALGEQVAALLDTEADVPGVTSGKIEPLFKTIGLHDQDRRRAA